MSAISNKLTAEEQTRLSYTEQTIALGLNGFIEVGKALIEIRDHKLYRETHKTFAAYIKERWSMGGAYAYRVMEAAAVVGLLPVSADAEAPLTPVQSEMSPIGDKSPETVPAPATEASVRPLTKLPKEKVAKVYAKAVEKAKGKAPSAKQVEEAVAEEQAEAAPEGAELPQVEDDEDDRPFPSSTAMTHAGNAIALLRNIHKEDPRWFEAFTLVRKFLVNQEIEWEENE